MINTQSNIHILSVIIWRYVKDAMNNDNSLCAHINKYTLKSIWSYIIFIRYMPSFETVPSGVRCRIEKINGNIRIYVYKICASTSVYTVKIERALEARL